MEADGSHSGMAVNSGNPLLRAVFLRRLRLTRLLLEGGAYINESDSQGQTPLMVACRTQHIDAQSASRFKLVQFLLEKGADPNIQDKEGHSALMHACREQAGHEVVSLLLASGADISLEDQSGTSALVHAVMAGDWRVLKLLLDTCKAKGKEVIIIATDKFPLGKFEVEQYLSTSPSDPLEETDKLASAAPASPSEIQLVTSPQCSSSSLCPPKPVFSFKEGKSCGVSSHPCSPSRYRGPGQGGAVHRLQQPLLRLNSEPWLPTSLPVAPSSAKNEDFPLSNSIQDGSSCKSHEGSLERDKVAKEGKEPCTKHTRQITSLPGLLLSHSASHPDLHYENLGPNSSCRSSKIHAPQHHSLASSSLHSIIQRRKLGSDIYNSDPQLDVNIKNLSTESRKLAPLHRSSTMCSTELLGPMYERRGSGTFLLDHNCQTKPRSLPPLTLNSSNTAYTIVNRAGPGFSGDRFLPSAPPGQPTEMTRRMILRRHSMQTERCKTTV